MAAASPNRPPSSTPASGARYAPPVRISSRLRGLTSRSLASPDSAPAPGEPLPWSPPPRLGLPPPTDNQRPAIRSICGAPRKAGHHLTHRITNRASSATTTFPKPERGKQPVFLQDLQAGRRASGGAPSSSACAARLSWAGRRLLRSFENAILRLGFSAPSRGFPLPAVCPFSSTATKNNGGRTFMFLNVPPSTRLPVAGQTTTFYLPGAAFPSIFFFLRHPVRAETSRDQPTIPP